MKAIRTTTISFGLVSIPVGLYKLEDDTKVKLKRLCSCGKAPSNEITCQCGETYGRSWVKVPNRGYEVSKGEYVVFSPEEVEAAESLAPEYPVMELEKVVDLKKLTVRYAVLPSYYVLPPEEASISSRKAYSLLVEALDTANWAILTRLSIRKGKRLALIPDKERNLLIAAEVSETRDVPYLPAREEVSSAEREMVAQILGASVDSEVIFDADADPIREMVNAKLAGEPVTVAAAVKAEKATDLAALLRKSLEA